MIRQTVMKYVQKGQSFSAAGVAVLVAIAAVVTQVQPSWSQGAIRSIWTPPPVGEGGFWCRYQSGLPTTVFRDVQGQDETWIHWSSSYYERAGYSNAERCEQVSARLNRQYVRQQLNYITVGMMNGERVICVASVFNGRCLESDGLIFTLKPGQDAVGTLMRLMNKRETEGQSVSLFESGGVPYIDVRERLRGGQTTSAMPTNEPRIP